MPEQANNNQEAEGSLKEITLFPFLTELFRPTAKLLGEELRDFTKEKINNIKERKREDNLKFHIGEIGKINQTNASTNNNSNEDPLLKNGTKILESLDAIQDIDQTEEELSKIWQNLIASLCSGQNIPRYIITVLKTLSPLEAKALITLRIEIENNFLFKLRQLFFIIFFPPYIVHFRHAETRHYLDVLKDKRLIRKTYLFEYFWIVVILTTSAAYFVALRYGINAFDKVDMNQFIQIATLPILLPIIIAFCNILFFILYAGIGRYEITWLGRELLKYSPLDKI